MGGPTWTQTRICTSRIFSSGDELDVLVAFNHGAYEAHKDDVTDGGVVIYDSGEFDLPGSVKGVGMPFDELAKSTGNARAANMVVMGALAFLAHMSQTMLEDFVVARFTRGRPNDDEIIRSNIQALSLGCEEASRGGFRLDELSEPTSPEDDQILVNGNVAVSLGAYAAGLDVFIGYPISPASSILVWMEQRLVGPDKFVHQATSEIESMSEGLGLAWMAEIPLVVADVQRGGPATGLPTKTEQSDLLAAMSPTHGDTGIPVIAPGTVEECFYATVAALNWAERYQGPVILLSEHGLSERQQNIPRPDLDNLVVECRKVYEGANGFNRYESPELGPMPIPGSPGSYVANGSEHDGRGDTTHLASRHIQMTKRRFGKLKLLDDGSYESRNEAAAIAVMPWGGSKGPALEAYEKLAAEGEDLGWFYTMYLNPFPPGLIEELKKKDLVLVPELNYQGQLSSILRSRGVNAESITQYTGLPFKVRDLAGWIVERIRTDRKEGIVA
jgi:2-oxoglutarate ferredoxin oxidoreductase subunit alpha